MSHNRNDSERESYTSTPEQRMDMVQGASVATTGTVSDVQVESYDESDPVAKKRIVI